MEVSNVCGDLQKSVLVFVVFGCPQLYLHRGVEPQVPISEYQYTLALKKVKRDCWPQATEEGIIGVRFKDRLE